MDLQKIADCGTIYDNVFLSLIIGMPRHDWLIDWLIVFYPHQLC